MKIFFQVLLLSFCFSFQTQSVADLKLKLKTCTSNEEKATLYIKIAQTLNYSNPDEVEQIATKAIQFSEKNKQVHADALQLIGNCYIITGKYKKATQIFSQIKTIYQEELPENYVGLIKTLGSLGVVASEQNRYDEALNSYFEALKIAEQHQDKKMLIVLHNNIGVIYRSTKQLEKAQNSFQKSAQIQLDTNDNQVGITFTNLATLEIATKNYKKAYQFLQQAKPFLTKLNDDRAWGEWNNNFGNYYLISKKFSEAETNLNQALVHFTTIKDQFGSADSYLLLANLFQIQNQNKKAILNAQKALELGVNLNVLDHKVRANKLLSELFETEGNLPKSFEYYKNYSQQKDSLVNEENARKLAEIELNNDFQKKEIKQQSEIKNSNFQKWLIGLVSIVIIMSLLSYFLWKSKKQVKQRLLLEKELIEYEQKALHLQMNPHFVFNCLGAISSYIVQNKSEDATKYLAMFSKLMRFTLESSKESLITIDKEIESITQYLNLENLRLNKIFTFSIEKSFGIEDDMALPPMLLQPIVENAIMHGILPMKQSGSITIKFYIKDELLFIEVIDNGVGIENSMKSKNKMSLHRSMAIDIVKKRLSMIAQTQEANASITFEQQKQGTNVKMRLAVQYKK